MNNLPTTAAGNDGLHLPTTKADGKLEAARDLLSLASRINDAADVLREVHSVLNDSTFNIDQNGEEIEARRNQQNNHTSITNCIGYN